MFITLTYISWCKEAWGRTSLSKRHVFVTLFNPAPFLDLLDHPILASRSISVRFLDAFFRVA